MKSTKHKTQSTILFVFWFLCFASLAKAHGLNEHIVRMTENGFEPKELTVVEGDEVLFINNDNTDRWPASNFHPTHTLYAEFDPLESVSSGESWKFKFEKAGNWRMHDHLLPHMTGSITVLEDENNQSQIGTSSEKTQAKPPGFWARIKNFLSKLFRKSENVSTAEFRSLSEREKYAKLEEISLKEGSEAAWRLVVDTYNTPEGVVGNPHDMAHLVGQLIFKDYGLKGLSICTPVFAFGCYHGLMEIAFNIKDKKEFEKTLLAAGRGCEDLLEDGSPPSETGYWSCIHGIGHGTATSREHNLDLSLKDCDLLTERVRTYCHDGVFMEFSISAPREFYKEDSPIYPCDAIDESYRSACARSQSRIMTRDFGFGVGQTAEICANTGDERIIYHCIDSLGYAVAQRNNPDEIIYSCGEIKDKKLEIQCLSAAAGELVFQNSVGWRESTKKVCGNETACLERVAQVKESYGR